MSQSKAPQAQEILEQYYRQLVLDIKQNGFCTELLGNQKDYTNTRLLCQTRCMYFLAEFASLFPKSEALNFAKKLYSLIKKDYQKQEQWLQYPNRENLDNLYEYAFLIFSISKLHQLDANHKYVKDLENLHHIIQKKYFFPDNNFENLQDKNGLVSQNALMHLYEAYLELCMAIPCETYQQTLKNLLASTHTLFFDKTKNLISEYYPYHNNPIYEPGHTFEWCCLMFETQSSALIESQQLLPFQAMANAAETLGVSPQQTVYQSLSHLNDKNRFRIWPMLERIRYYALQKEQNKLDKILPEFINYFISAETKLPIEWITDRLEPDFTGVKTTTAYHLINAFKHLV